MFNISINSHSSIKISTQNKNIYIDPFNIEKDNHDAYAVLITHSHYDHFSIEDIKKVRDSKTVFIVPTYLKSQLLDLGVKEENLLLLKSGDIVKTEFFSAVAVKSYNINKKFHPKDSGNLGYIISVENKNVYIAGDSDLTEDALNISCDYALIPIGGTYTMDFKEGAKLVNAIKPKVAIPTHYGSIVGSKDLGEKFAKLVDKNIEVKILL